MTFIELTDHEKVPSTAGGLPSPTLHVQLFVVGPSNNVISVEWSLGLRVVSVNVNGAGFSGTPLHHRDKTNTDLLPAVIGY